WFSLRKFYDRYYVASNMGVVVYGGEPLDTLEQWARDSFSAVPAGPKPDLTIGENPYTGEGLGVRINVVPLKDTRVLSLSFPLPSTEPYYQKKPLGYLARIVGYEGQGSLHSLLKEKGLINSLAAYSSDLPNEFSEFTVRVELTHKGLDQVDEITGMVFDYLDLIRREGLQQRLFDESKQIAELGFRYQEDRNPQQTVSALAARMHYLPAEHILDANYLYESFDASLIEDFLSQMTPANLRQVVIAQGLPTDQVEPYFETHYSIHKLPGNLIKRLNRPLAHEALTIPAPNPFVASDLQLREAGVAKEPEVIVDEKGLRVWSMTDTSFEVPRGNVRVMVSTSKASATPDDNVLIQLYRALLSRSLNEYGYPARETGLNYSLSAGRRGLMISLSGYQDKQSILLEYILKEINQFKPEPESFEQEKVLLVRGLKNKQFHVPYRLGMDALGQVTYPSYPEDEVML
ncbi:MAG: insulinase family protein, partial [Endozoicomonas sp.]